MHPRALAIGAILLVAMASQPSAERLATRALHRTLPLWLQHGMRDSGMLGVGVDAATMIGAGIALASRPELLSRLVRASATGRLGVPYGPLRQHRLDIFEPQHSAAGTSEAGTSDVVLFVHGGAWGSGSRLIYRLVGERIAAEGFTCLVLGYRRYPRASIAEQVDDVDLALRWAAESAELAGRALHVLGHSSGAHVTCMAALRRAQARAPPLCASLVGVAGVYDIARHLEYERGRGVHEVSPMKPASGGPRGFAAASPTIVASQLLPEQAALMPPVLLVHGTEDTTVPHESSARMASALRAAGAADVALIVLAEKGHADLMLELSGLVPERRFSAAPSPAQWAGSGTDVRGEAEAGEGAPMRALDPILRMFARLGRGAARQVQPPAGFSAQSAEVANAAESGSTVEGTGAAVPSEPPSAPTATLRSKL